MKCKRNERSVEPPPPFMIFCSKLEISQCNSDESGHYKQKNEDYKQYGVDGVDFLTPYTFKYVIELNVDGTKW